MSFKVVITGTESTGKTCLGEQLASYYKTILVQDVSRNYLQVHGKEYDRNDVLEIAQQIIVLEGHVSSKNNNIWFTDNDLINIKIWLQFYKWEVPLWLEKAIRQRKPDLFLLMNYDLPWQQDELRQNPDDREILFNRFSDELAKTNAPVTLISGKEVTRFQNAVTAISRLYNPIPPLDFFENNR